MDDSARLGRAEAATLAIPLGVSASFTTGGLVILLALGASLLWPPAPDSPAALPASYRALTAGASVIGLVIAWGLARLDRWARGAAFGHAVLDLAATVQFATDPRPPWYRVGIDLACLAVLLVPQVARWFEEP